MDEWLILICNRGIKTIKMIELIGGISKIKTTVLKQL